MKLILMRGLPGSGKSTKANELALQMGNTIICSTDDFFVEDGKYVFQPNMLSEAHEWNLRRARAAMRMGANVIVDNTNIKRSHMSKYIHTAKELNFEVEEVVVGMDNLTHEMIDLYHQRNTHGVPLHTIQRMAAEFED